MREAVETPILFLIGGPGGCEKTTLARELALRMQMVHLSRDEVKAAMATSSAVITAGISGGRSSHNGTSVRRACKEAPTAVAGYARLWVDRFEV